MTLYCDGCGEETPGPLPGVDSIFCSRAGRWVGCGPCRIHVGDIVRAEGRRGRVLTPPYTTLGALYGDVHETVTIEALDDGELGRFPVESLELIERPRR